MLRPPYVALLFLLPASLFVSTTTKNLVISELAKLRYEFRVVYFFNAKTSPFHRLIFFKLDAIGLSAALQLFIFQ